MSCSSSARVFGAVGMRSWSSSLMPSGSYQCRPVASRSHCAWLVMASTTGAKLLIAIAPLSKSDVVSSSARLTSSTVQ